MLLVFLWMCRTDRNGKAVQGKAAGLALLTTGAAVALGMRRAQAPRIHKYYSFHAV